ncbi:DinB family protein [Galbibacter mesophilus]|uniref:DinB family protein n=1 Tax=Galbibacter mesophilus TaxID=379069 RepID=UPI00191F09B6|nr:DinB family protein [Galbibacter mesophilus]MCM5663278.1 DinB family protein [Galbibacter mesophilus]
MIRYTAKSNLLALKEIISKLSLEQFKEPILVLNHSSIGMHVRHVLEFYQCLFNAVSKEVLNYDDRLRNKQIETDLSYCLTILDEILLKIDGADENSVFTLFANYAIDGERAPEEVQTTMKRELIYNIEHTVHHLAIIKIGVKALDPSIEFNENIGVAASTLRFKKACAQ